MASIANDPNGYRRIQFVSPDGKRKSIRLGKVSMKIAEGVRHRVENLLSSCIANREPSREDTVWLEGVGQELRSKLEAVGLVEPLEPEPKKDVPTLAEHLQGFLDRVGPAKKPGTVAVWRQVVANLNELLPVGIRLDEITVGHAKAFLEGLRAKGMESTTIHKRIGFAKQFVQDAVDWEIIDKNPFAKIKTSTPSTKSNVEVTRETIGKVLAVCDPTWQTIVALSRFGGLRCPSETLSLRWADIDWEQSRMNVPEPKVEHHEGRGVRSVPIFPELMPYLQAAWDRAPEGAEFVIDKPAYRAAADTSEGWKNCNLRTQFLKMLAKAGVKPWARLFHSMRASRQTELEHQYPTHVVCHWLGNSPQVARKSYLLVTNADFAKAISSCGAPSGAVDPEIGAKSGAVESRTDSQAQEAPLTKTLVISGKTNEIMGQTSGGQGIRTLNRFPGA